MKRYIFLPLFIMMTFLMNSQEIADNKDNRSNSNANSIGYSQLFKTTNLKEKAAMGMLCGASGLQDNFGMFDFGFCLMVKGVYADFLVGLSKSLNTTVYFPNTDIEEKHRRDSFLFHVGYQVPISRMIRIIPVFGYHNLSELSIDKSSWYMEDGNMRYKIKSETKYKGVDYGAVLNIRVKEVSILTGITRHSLFAGICYVFD